MGDRRRSQRSAPFSLTSPSERLVGLSIIEGRQRWFGVRTGGHREICQSRNPRRQRGKSDVGQRDWLSKSCRPKRALVIQNSVRSIPEHGYIEEATQADYPALTLFFHGLRRCGDLRIPQKPATRLASDGAWTIQGSIDWIRIPHCRDIVIGVPPNSSPLEPDLH